MTNKRPTESRRFSFGRSVSEDGLITWRLFRRSSVNNRLFLSIVMGRDRSKAAHALRHARMALRERVDAYDLEMMGIAA